MRGWRHKRFFVPIVLTTPWLRHLGVDGMAPLPGICLIVKPLPAGPARDMLLRHEAIHHRQQLETLVLPFYLLYATDYLRHRLRGHGHWPAYRNVCFEREAYLHQANPAYLGQRRWYAWIRHL